jgi:hypothetical protein
MILIFFAGGKRNASPDREVGLWVKKSCLIKRQPVAGNLKRVYEKGGGVVFGNVKN